MKNNQKLPVALLLMLSVGASQALPRFAAAPTHPFLTGGCCCTAGKGQCGKDNGYYSVKGYAYQCQQYSFATNGSKTPAIHTACWGFCHWVTNTISCGLQASMQGNMHQLAGRMLAMLAKM